MLEKWLSVQDIIGIGILIGIAIKYYQILVWEARRGEGDGYVN